jgi:BirA family biotin operon repressor/biotin-[acetyl-CoA-carboxylase] ligase
VLEGQEVLGKRAKSKESDAGWQKVIQDRTIAGHPVIYFSETDSTNDRCMEMGVAGAQTGTLVLADSQTGGKGRLGKSWFSCEGGGLYFSLLLRPSLQPQDLSKITLAGGVALCRAVDRLYSLSPMLKWPNDLLLEGKKCGGILVEADLRTPSSPVVILGIGINVTTPLAEFPRELQGRVTSLQCHVPGKVVRSELLTVILEDIENVISQFERQGFADILREWKTHDATFGKKLTWLTADFQKVKGISLGPDDEGRLHIKDEQEIIHEVLSGDIRLHS